MPPTPKANRTHVTQPPKPKADGPRASQADNDHGVAPHHDSETNTQSIENKKEIGGRGGLDPARYGDWEVNGRCYDF